MSEQLRPDITPEFQKWMEQQGIIFAHATTELPNWGKRIGYTIDTLLRLYFDEQSPPWSRLKGLRILDIGAGSHLNNQRAQPLFARTCAINGAEVVVADILDQSELDKKLFAEVITADLIPPIMGGTFSQFPQLKGREFDVIVAINFLGSNADPVLQRMLYDRDLTPELFATNLQQQAIILLAEGGILHLGEGFYRQEKR